MTRKKFSFAFGATGTELTAICHENGVCSSIILVTPSFTNVVTTTLSVLDQDGDTVWTDGTPRARGTTTLIGSLAIPFDRGYTVKATLSGAAGGSGGTAVAKLFIERR
jgi:uncharacterized protein (DUF1786 family)